MLQDECKELSRWLATRPGARGLVDMRVAEIANERAALAPLIKPAKSDHDCALERGGVMCRTYDLDTIAAGLKTPNAKLTGITHERHHDDH